MANASAWRYVGDPDEGRVHALLTAPPSSDLARAVATRAQIACYHWEPRDGAPQYGRAIFCAVVGESLFDWFFNAPTGYRAAYFEDPDTGTRQNRALVDALTQLLLASLADHGSGPDKGKVRASLAASSAKLWLAEQPGLCKVCAGDWSSNYKSTLHIENARWERSEHVHAKWGQQAPRFRKLRIFGGFVDGSFEEWLASHKERRASHIWEHGWS